MDLLILSQPCREHNTSTTQPQLCRWIGNKSDCACACHPHTPTTKYNVIRSNKHEHNNSIDNNNNNNNNINNINKINNINNINNNSKLKKCQSNFLLTITKHNMNSYKNNKNHNNNITTTTTTKKPQYNWVVSLSLIA